MQSIPYASSWRKLSFALTVLLVAVVAFVLAVSTVLASKRTTVGANAPAETSAAISPMELMITHGRQLPATEYVEPF